MCIIKFVSFLKLLSDVIEFKLKVESVYKVILFLLFLMFFNGLVGRVIFKYKLDWCIGVIVVLNGLCVL